MPVFAYLIMVNIPPEKWSSAVVPQEQVIGRDEQADIRIPVRFQAVSRQHAVIWADPVKNQVFIRDLGSRCGTSINGVYVKADQPYGLVMGDRITLAALELQVTASIPPLPSIIAELKLPADICETWNPAELGRGSGEDARQMLKNLSNAELEVMLWLCRGFTDLEALGRNLHRSPHTVRTQFNSIFRKLDVHSREELVGKVRRANAEPGSGSHRLRKS